MKWIVGVDEAGRGPLAGPVTVGLVCVPVNFDWGLVSGVRDSKKLSEKKREEIFKRVQELQTEGKLQYVVKSVSAQSIDSKGIAPAIRRSIAAGLYDLLTDGKPSTKSRGNTPINWSIAPTDCHIKLDGSLTAPAEFIHQETIIKGDDKELVIGLASIMAKVTRDRYMVEQDKKYPQYGLAQHKGYGTKAHREAIARHGFSPIHRQSYCKNIVLL